MKAGEPLTVREASFISLLMGHTERTGAATVRFTMHVDGSLDGQINIKSEYSRQLERAERECAAPARRGCAAARWQPHRTAGQARPRQAQQGRGAQGCAPRQQERTLRARRRWAAAAVPLLVARRSGPPLPAPPSAATSYDSETPDEITNEALFRACRAYGL